MERARLIIYPQDIQRITGRSERYARKILTKVKKRLGKEKHQLVTCDEFCNFLGLPAEDVERYLR